MDLNPYRHRLLSVLFSSIVSFLDNERTNFRTIMRAFLFFAVTLAFASLVLADSDEGPCGCIAERSTQWRTVTDDRGRVYLDNDVVFGECLERILPVNECNGDAECEKEFERAYKFHREVLTFDEKKGEYETAQEWDLQCSDQIFPDDDDDRVRMHMVQNGDWEVVSVSDDSDGSFVCRMTFEPNDGDDCEGYFKIGSNDGNANKMCDTCKDACDDCDGAWVPDVNDRFYCSSPDERLFFAPDPCDRGCRTFDLDRTIQRTFRVNGDCTEMTSEWYGEEFTYVPGSASSLSCSVLVMVVFLVLSVLF